MILIRSATRLSHKVALYNLAIVLFFFGLIVGIPSPANAQQEPNVIDWLDEKQANKQTEVKQSKETVTVNNSDQKSPILLIFQLIFYLIIILVLIYALIKFLALKQKKLQPNQAINLVGGTPLGNNKSLQLVKIAGKVYLIGVADQITLIKEFSNADEINMLESDLEKQPTFFSNSFPGISKKQPMPFFNSLFGFSKKQPNINQNGRFVQIFNQSLDKQKEKQSQLEHDLFDGEKEGRER
jgi:flagellar protein FliO/FliZ